MGLFSIKTKKNKFLGLWKATTRNDKGDLIIRHGKTKKQAIRFAKAERDQQNRIIKKRRTK